MTAPDPTVEGALAAYRAARDAYKDDRSDEAKEAYRVAGEEVRYRRWVARGGPSREWPHGTPGAEFAARWTAEQEG